MKETYFAPPEKTDRRKFGNQLESLSKDPLMTTLLTTMSGLLVVLNEDRQIVAMNSAFLQAIGYKDPEAAIGLRLGQSLNCIHGHEKPAGCGTTLHCSTCGAVIAMMTAIREDRTNEQICALTTEQNGIIKNLCLIVKAQPLTLDGNRWILVFVQDITQQHFWINLERIFFHDIRNILGSLTASTEMLKLETLQNNKVDDHLVDMIMKATRRLSEEISIQSVLAHEKNTAHLFKNAQTTMDDIRGDLDIILSRHPLRKTRTIEAFWPDEPVTLNTVSLLVSRVLGNMAVNAMEAGEEGDSIRLFVHVSTETVRFDVWNAQAISPENQKRIFQLHYSTKPGGGRGLGTYSMKLFGEKYLHGSVSFTSSKEGGTTFSLTLPR